MQNFSLPINPLRHLLSGQQEICSIGLPFATESGGWQGQLEFEQILWLDQLLMHL